MKNKHYFIANSNIGYRNMGAFESTIHAKTFFQYLIKTWSQRGYYELRDADDKLIDTIKLEHDAPGYRKAQKIIGKE